MANVPANEQTRFRAKIRFVFSAITLLFIVALLNVIRTGVAIDTNLRSLAPSLTPDAASENLINQLSAAASRKATVVLASTERTKVAAAAEQLQTAVTDLSETNGGVKVADSTESAADFVRVLEAFPYNFVRPNLAPLLASQDDEKLIQWVLEQLYGGAGQVRVTGFESDPFGVLNDYVLAIQNTVATEAADDIQAVQHEGKTFFLSVWQFELPGDGLALNAQAEWVAQLAQIQTTLQKEFPAVQWLQTGMIFFAADSAQSAQRNINLITSIGMLGVVILMLLIFRGMRPLLASVSAILTGVGFAFVICHSIWSSIHILTLLFGASLIGVAVDYSLHLYYFHYDRKKNLIAENASSHFYPALLLSLLTSVVGYGALAMSGLETLRQVAVFSIAGLVYACLWVLVTESWAIKKLIVRDLALTRITSTCVYWCGRIAKVRYLIILGAGIWLVLAVQKSHIVFDDSPKAFIAQNSVLMNSEQLISRWLGDYEPATFVLIHGKNDQEVFDKIALLNSRVQNAPQVLQNANRPFLSVHSFVPSPQEQKTAYRLNAALYQNAAVANALTSVYEVTSAEDMQRVTQRYAGWSGNVLTPTQLFDQIEGLPRLWVEQKTDDQKLIYTALLIPKNADLVMLRRIATELPDTEVLSLVQQTQSGLRDLRATASFYLALALLLIGAVFVWRYGAYRAMILLLVPITVLGGIGLFYLVAQVPITLFHVMAAFLVLGLGVDYLVFAAEMNSEKKSATHFANALVLSAATSTLSFGLLSLSVLPAVAAFGLTAMLGIWGNLIGAFIVLSIWQNLREK